MQRYDMSVESDRHQDNTDANPLARFDFLLQIDTDESWRTSELCSLTQLMAFCDKKVIYT